MGQQEDIFELEGVTEAQMAQHLHIGGAAADAAQPHRSGWEGVATVESATDVSLNAAHFILKTRIAGHLLASLLGVVLEWQLPDIMLSTVCV